MFEKVIVLGRGKTALGCVKFLVEQGIEPEFFCVGKSVGPMKNQVKSLLGEPAAERLFQEKEEMTERLFAERKRTLIVSAVNSYLLPRKVLEKDNVVAVNFHNAYLPRHPGRNAEAWTIFEQDSYAGVTWHYVTPQVDAGKIIVQEKIPLSEETTSFMLLQKQDELALELFRKWFDEIFREICEGTKQTAGEAKMHYSWERPNDGFLDLTWNGDTISAFLRSFDYGILSPMGRPFTVIEGKKYCWKRYFIEKCASDSDEVMVGEDNLTIQKAGKKFLLENMTRIE